MKTKFIIHGGYTRYANDLNHSFLHEVVKDMPGNGTLLIVLFATDDEKVDEYFRNFTDKFADNADGKKLNYTKATKEDFLNQVTAADAIYIQGGDTEKLKQVLQEYPEFAERIKGKTVAGSSAGAYVLSRYYYTNSQNKVLEGLGVLPIRTVCHYQSEIHSVSDNIDPVSCLNEFDNDMELVLLKDFEWKMFTI